MISDLGVGIWDLVAETRPVGRVSLDFGFWIVDFVSVPWFFLCFGDLVAETRPVGRVSLDFGFRILDFVSVPWFFLCFGDLVAETRPVGRVSLDFGFWIVDFGSCFRAFRGSFCVFPWSSLSVSSVVRAFGGHLFPCFSGGSVVMPAEKRLRVTTESREPQGKE
jgi:hypothetical protein